MKNERYEFLLKYLESSFEGERNFIANLANASAVINQNLENLIGQDFICMMKKT